MWLIILCAVLALALMVYLIVGGTGKASSESRRAHARVDLAVPVKVETAEQNFVADCQNISHGGMMLKAGAAVKVAQPVQLSFTLPEQTTVDIPGVICHKRGEEIGVRFDPTHQRRSIIERWVRRKTEEHHRRAAKASS